MKFPADAPEWLVRLLVELEDTVERQVSEAMTMDSAMKSSGAYGLWKLIKNEMALEADKQLKEIREQRIALNARPA